MNTIPLARISFDDDDRPAGLKLDRSNGYAFQRSGVGGGGSRYDDDLAWLSQKSDNRSSVESETDRFLMSRGPFTRTSNSPSVPARSPFRIRDSQQSTNTSVKPGPLSPKAVSSLDDRVTSSKQPTRLSMDVAQLWKHKPTPTSDQTAKDRDPKNDMEELLKQVLVSQALVDARDYEMLHFDQVDQLKKQQAILRDQIANLRTRLAVAKRVRDASNSLLQLDTGESQPRENSPQEQSIKATQQVESIAVELMSLIAEEAEVRQQILQHTASALRLGQLSQTVQPTPVSPEVTTPAPPPPVLPPPPPPPPADDHSRQELEQLTSALDTMMRRYQLTNSSPNLERSDSGFSSSNEWSVLLSTMETEFKEYKYKVERLERQLESNEEKLRLESMSTKKYEVQLRMAQEKRETAEARCRELEKTKGSLDQELAQLDASLTGMTYNKDKVVKLEAELLEATARAERAEGEISNNQSLISELQASVADLELRCTKAESESHSLASRDKAMAEELSKTQSDLMTMRAEKQRWERALKRESVMQMMEGGSESYKAKYEQQMEEQRQEYEAQLKEQQALLDKTTRTKEQLVADNEKMASICKDLEDLIRDKSRAIDARDVRINQLEQDLAEAHRRAGNSGTGSKSNAQVAELQKAFTAREEAWLAQSAAMETDFEGIMKEFDRLTISAMEFETDRMKYEQRIEQLTREFQALESELTEKKINGLGLDTAEGPTTASLRKEFRKLVSDLKADHQRVVDRETKERRNLESRLRDMKHEREMARYERVNRGVQTYFIPDM